MHPQAEALPQAIRPALLAALVDELDRARGRGLIAPMIKLTLLTTLPALVITWGVGAGHPGFEALLKDRSFGYALIAMLLMTPAFDTMIMGLLFWLLGKWFGRPHTLNLGGALLWGALHGQSAAWGFHAIWTFYVLGAVFLRLQARPQNRAYFTVILLQALHYLIICTGLLLG